MPGAAPCGTAPGSHAQYPRLQLAIFSGFSADEYSQRIELVMRFFLALGEGVEAPVAEAPPQTSPLEEPTTSVMDAGSDTASIFEMGRR